MRRERQRRPVWSVTLAVCACAAAATIAVTIGDVDGHQRTPKLASGHVTLLAAAGELLRRRLLSGLTDLVGHLRAAALTLHRMRVVRLVWLRFPFPLQTLKMYLPRPRKRRWLHTLRAPSRFQSRWHFPRMVARRGQRRLFRQAVGHLGPRCL